MHEEDSFFPDQSVVNWLLEMWLLLLPAYRFNCIIKQYKSVCVCVPAE
jgi:hypothetical protein